MQPSRARTEEQQQQQQQQQQAGNAEDRMQDDDAGKATDWMSSTPFKSSVRGPPRSLLKILPVSVSATAKLPTVEATWQQAFPSYFHSAVEMERRMKQVSLRYILAKQSRKNLDECLNGVRSDDPVICFGRYVFTRVENELVTAQLCDGDDAAIDALSVGCSCTRREGGGVGLCEHAHALLLRASEQPSFAVLDLNLAVKSNLDDALAAALQERLITAHAAGGIAKEFAEALHSREHREGARDAHHETAWSEPELQRLLTLVSSLHLDTVMPSEDEARACAKELLLGLQAKKYESAIGAFRESRAKFEPTELAPQLSERVDASLCFKDGNYYSSSPREAVAEDALCERLLHAGRFSALLMLDQSLDSGTRERGRRAFIATLRGVRYALVQTHDASKTGALYDIAIFLSTLALFRWGSSSTTPTAVSGDQDHSLLLAKAVAHLNGSGSAEALAPPDVREFLGTSCAKDSKTAALAALRVLAALVDDTPQRACEANLHIVEALFFCSSVKFDVPLKRVATALGEIDLQVWASQRCVDLFERITALVTSESRFNLSLDHVENSIFSFCLHFEAELPDEDGSLAIELLSKILQRFQALDAISKRRACAGTSTSPRTGLGSTLLKLLEHIATKHAAALPRAIEMFSPVLAEESIHDLIFKHGEVTAVTRPLLFTETFAALSDAWQIRILTNIGKSSSRDSLKSVGNVKVAYEAASEITLSKLFDALPWDETYQLHLYSAFLVLFIRLGHAAQQSEATLQRLRQELERVSPTLTETTASLKPPRLAIAAGAGFILDCGTPDSPVLEALQTSLELADLGSFPRLYTEDRTVIDEGLEKLVRRAPESLSKPALLAARLMAHKATLSDVLMWFDAIQRFQLSGSNLEAELNVLLKSVVTVLNAARDLDEQEQLLFRMHFNFSSLEELKAPMDMLKRTASDERSRVQDGRSQRMMTTQRELIRSIQAWPCHTAHQASKAFGTCSRCKRGLREMPDLQVAKFTAVASSRLQVEFNSIIYLAMDSARSQALADHLRSFSFPGVGTTHLAPLTVPKMTFAAVKVGDAAQADDDDDVIMIEPTGARSMPWLNDACPFTLQKVHKLEEPVRDKPGYVYEKAAVEGYIRSKGGSAQAPIGGAAHTIFIDELAPAKEWIQNTLAAMPGAAAQEDEAILCDEDED